VRFVNAIVFCLGSSLAAACGGSGGEPGSATGTGGSGGTGGSDGGGDGGGVANVDMCVLTSMKTCQNDYCHGAVGTSAGLLLTPPVLTHDFKDLLVDKPNHGDPLGCPPGIALLIDTSDATKSLMYTKLTQPPAPCGQPMPVIGTFTAEDKMCVLSWIESVIQSVKGP
jgi:hypothetical protein